MTHYIMDFEVISLFILIALGVFIYTRYSNENESDVAALVCDCSTGVTHAGIKPANISVSNRPLLVIYSYGPRS